MTDTLELIRGYAGDVPPLAKFAIVMAIIVGIPPLFKRIGLPGLQCRQRHGLGQYAISRARQAILPECAVHP